MDSTLPQTASTAVVNIALAWIAGVLAARSWLAHANEPWQNVANQRLNTALTAGLMAAFAGIVLSLWTESSAMGDVPWLDAWPACKEMLTSTHYGHAGVTVLVLLAAALLVQWNAGREGHSLRNILAVTVIMLLVAVARVTIGHAFEDGPLHPAMWIEWLHLVLMSVWAGIVFVSGWLVLPLYGRQQRHADQALAAYLHTMSNWAATAVVGILATGLYNSWRVLNGPRDLIDIDYGNVLLLKITFVLLAIILGGYNKFRGLPDALKTDSVEQSRRGIRTVTVVLKIESIALFLVLVCASLLATSAPPGQ
jgi:putative copper resistance protein D